MVFLLHYLSFLELDSHSPLLLALHNQDILQDGRCVDLLWHEQASLLYKSNGKM